MRRSSLSALICCGFLVLLAGCAGFPGGSGDKSESGPSPEEATLTEVGQAAPDFSLPTLDGGSFTLSGQQGKVVLINWFATWCPPCQEEMPHLQKEVWEVFQDRQFVMVSVARQETAAEVGPFVKKYGVTWPFLLDEDRAAYARYAEAFIPRNNVLDRNGKIIFQSNGFEKEDFQEMIAVIRAELDR